MAVYLVRALVTTNDTSGDKVDELDLSGLGFSAGREKLQDESEDKLEETCLLIYNDIMVAFSCGN
ncbi:MAG TPA: hypothetical protein VN374_04175 [Desulfitobacteriaceae bacterium]|nr:hypothetical protein [Desulfitobacteriaceae bacterium]